MQHAPSVLCVLALSLAIAASGCQGQPDSPEQKSESVKHQEEPQTKAPARTVAQRVEESAGGGEQGKTPPRGTWGDKLVTPNYIVTITHLCKEEGCVSCSNMIYHGVSRKSGKSITLKGSTWHTRGADGVTPSRFLGYRFENGDIMYRVHQSGLLEVLKGDSAILISEQGTWYQ